MKQTTISIENGMGARRDAASPETASDAVLWLDVEGPAAELETYFQPEGLSQSLLHKALAEHRFPTAYATHDFVTLSLPVRRTWAQKSAAFITFVLQGHRVITLHEGNNYDFESLRMQLEAGDIAITDAPSLLLYLFESLIETNIHCFISARTHTENLSFRMDKAPRSVNEREVMLARRQVSRLISQFENQFYGLTDLQSLLQHQQMTDSTRQRLRDIGEAQNHLARNVLRLETVLRDLAQHCQYLVQQQSDQRLRQLTVLSIIFMPLTLITGVYGMNFSYLPGTEWKYGYYSMLGAMISLAVGLLYYLKRRGWFK